MPSPSSSTSPAGSMPTTAGYVLTIDPYFFIFQSTGFKDVACTLTRISPGPGFGMLTVSTVNGPLADLSKSAFWVRGAIVF